MTGRKPMRALIVDNSRFVRGFLRSLLEEKGIACQEAGDEKLRMLGLAED
jgi:hypothetical protein